MLIDLMTEAVRSILALKREQMAGRLWQAVVLLASGVAKATGTRMSFNLKTSTSIDGRDIRHGTFMSVWATEKIETDECSNVKSVN